ncbi:MAG: hypothetical protein V8S24_00015 [Gordonibacter pamelaeae]
MAGQALNPEPVRALGDRRGLHQRLPADRPRRRGAGRQSAEGELLGRHRRQLGPHVRDRRRGPFHHHGKCPYTFDQLVEAGGHAYDEWNATYRKHEKGMLRPDGQVGFNTPPAASSWCRPSSQSWGIPPYPVYTPAPETWETTPEIMEVCRST